MLSFWHWVTCLWAWYWITLVGTVLDSPQQCKQDLWPSKSWYYIQQLRHEYSIFPLPSYSGSQGWTPKISLWAGERMSLIRTRYSLVSTGSVSKCLSIIALLGPLGYEVSLRDGQQLVLHTIPFLSCSPLTFPVSLQEPLSRYCWSKRVESSSVLRCERERERWLRVQGQLRFLIPIIYSP